MLNLSFKMLKSTISSNDRKTTKREQSRLHRFCSASRLSALKQAISSAIIWVRYPLSLIHVRSMLFCRRYCTNGVHR